MPVIYRTDIASDAEFQVYRTIIRSEADLVVFETQDTWDASDAAIWCYTDIRSEADHAVFFCDNRWDADLMVYRTDVRSDAGWLNSDKQGLL